MTLLNESGIIPYKCMCAVSHKFIISLKFFMSTYLAPGFIEIITKNTYVKQQNSGIVVKPSKMVFIGTAVF